MPIASPWDEHGRGLALVAKVANAWGVIPNHKGKAVWFRLTN
ncbi:MAG: hypothetical protein ACRD0I_05635 [Acidimicrobiales bacterium]